MIAVSRRNVLPGFGLTMGLTLTWLTLLILLPLVVFNKYQAEAGTGRGG